MTLEQLIALGLAGDVAKKVAEESTKELSGYVEKTKYTELEAQKKQLEEGKGTLEKQIENIKKSAGNNEELKKQIEQMQAENKAKVEEYEKNLAQIKLDNALEISLMNSGSKNTKAVRALLEMEKIKLEDGKLVGVDEQLTELKKSADYLFNVEGEKTPTPPAGTKPSAGSGDPGAGGQDVTLGSALKSLYTK